MAVDTFRACQPASTSPRSNHFDSALGPPPAPVQGHKVCGGDAPQFQGRTHDPGASVLRLGWNSGKGGIFSRLDL